MKVFFTADTHFGHSLMREKRGYENRALMDQDMVKIWNDIVSPEDHVYHLGDVSFHGRKYTAQFLWKLNGKIHLIRGNHDRAIKGDLEKRFEWVKDMHTYKSSDGKQRVVLCHFPLLTWDRAHYGTWHFHGHSHGNLKTVETTRQDVGWDVFGRPTEFAELTEIMSKRSYKTVDHHA